MAVHARGYRAYTGGFRAPPAALAIAGEAYRTAVRSVAYRRIRIFFLVWFVIVAFLLYLQVGSEIAIFVQARLMSQVPEGEMQSFLLRSALRVFYVGVAILTALLSILVGAGLISNDLGSRALQLYLVRPVRPVDYVIGKALVLPLVLFWMASAASYTGIVLFLSSRSSRRTAVAVVAAAVILGGALLRIVSFTSRLEGPLAEGLRLAGIPQNTVTPFLRDIWPIRWPRGMNFLPEISAIAVLSAALLILGLVSAWVRARSVEVTG
ncbi:MAG: hypothetical protein ACYTG6_12985 [Planctomycetota bacterium]|jgi:hypothetical protein